MQTLNHLIAIAAIIGTAAIVIVPPAMNAAANIKAAIAIMPNPESEQN